MKTKLFKIVLTAFLLLPLAGCAVFDRDDEILGSVQDSEAVNTDDYLVINLVGADNTRAALNLSQVNEMHLYMFSKTSKDDTNPVFKYRLDLTAADIAKVKSTGYLLLPKRFTGFFRLYVTVNFKYNKTAGVELTNSHAGMTYSQWNPEHSFMTAGDVNTDNSYPVLAGVIGSHTDQFNRERLNLKLVHMKARVTLMIQASILTQLLANTLNVSSIDEALCTTENLSSNLIGKGLANADETRIDYHKPNTSYTYKDYTQPFYTFKQIYSSNLGDLSSPYTKNGYYYVMDRYVNPKYTNEELTFILKFRVYPHYIYLYHTSTEVYAEYPNTKQFSLILYKDREIKQDGYIHVVAKKDPNGYPKWCRTWTVGEINFNYYENNYVYYKFQVGISQPSFISKNVLPSQGEFCINGLYPGCHYKITVNTISLYNDLPGVSIEKAAPLWGNSLITPYIQLMDHTNTSSFSDLPSWAQ